MGVYVGGMVGHYVTANSENSTIISEQVNVIEIDKNCECTYNPVMY